MKHKPTAIVRTIIQLSVFALVLLIALSKWLLDQGVVIPLLPDASLHAICPFGGVVTVYEFLTTGMFVQKIHSSSLILMLIGIVVALLLGGIFCGYVCPFGSFQEWIGKLGKKLFPKRYNRFLPKKLDGALRYLRYVVLALVVYQTATTAKLLFQNIDPYYALFNFFTNEVAISAYVILGVTLVLSLFVERPWCKYACPYGAFLGLFNLIRIFPIRRNTMTCISCKKCDKVCPMNIDVSATQTVRNHQCIACHRCTSDETCPVANTVVIRAKKEEPNHEA